MGAVITSTSYRGKFTCNEASVSNDGKIPGFRKFLFLSSVIKFDNK